MERPGLKQLLADVAAGKVDVVVIYKIDRLTRSLADFARIVEVLENHGASFVSVTQSFNTTTSMGRLTLNVLLSLRPVRARGRRRADARQDRRFEGQGHVDGWDRAAWLRCRRPQARDQRQEASTVRAIFSRFVELKSVQGALRWAQREGLRTKQRQRTALDWRQELRVWLVTMHPLQPALCWRGRA